MHYRTLLLAASTLATLGAWSGAAVAQDAQATTIEDIVVTAQKREERLQDVPMSISAVTGQDLERRGATGLMDLQYSVPGLSAVEYGPGQERVQIRGISNQLGLPTVGRYLDEMPINIDQQGLALDLRFLDMARVEVLRGPQGTLYGEGSMGGTIRYITADPDLSQFGVDLEAQAGSVTDGGTSGRTSAVLNLPLIEDRLGLRLVAGYENQAGWVDNTVTGHDDINDAEIRTVRAKALAKFTDNVEASLLFMHQENDQDSQNFGIDRESTSVLPEYNNQRYDLANAVVNWDLGFADLVNSFGWIDYEAETQSDISPVYVPILMAALGLPAGFIDTVGLAGAYDSRVLTNELRLSSKPGGSIDWTVGVYARDFKIDVFAATPTAPGDLGFDLISGLQSTTSQSWSVFGEIGWHPTDSLTVSAGLRQFSDKRGFDSNVTNFGLSSVDSDSDTFNSLNPRFNVAYAPSPDSLFYLNAAKGFRSGGFNAESSGAGFPIPLTYDPESLWTYEAGTKQQWFDRRLTFEGAVYYNDWQDVQSSLFAPGSAVGVVLNGGDVQGWGVDLSMVGRPAAGLTLSGTYGWNDMEYKTATLDKQVGDPVDYAVRETWSASIDWRRTVFSGTQGFARLDYQHAGEAQITFRNQAVLVEIPERDLFNARIGLDFGRFEASIFADNLTDEDAPLIPGPFGIISQDIESRPRTVGVNVKARF